jgi:uncharacterized protein (TIGR02001 family)
VRSPGARCRSRLRRFGAPRGAILLWFALGAADAGSQVSGSISVVSNYRYRGGSLSHNDPAAQTALVYDHPHGFFAGAFASTVRIGQPTSDEAQGILFAGYARTLASGVTAEVGIDYQGFIGGTSYAYPELFVGAAYENVSGRLYYSPDYYGQGADAVYGEINAAYRILDRARIVGHFGVLWTNARNIYGYVVDPVLDGRLGVVFDFERFNVELSWVGISAASTGYGLTGVRSRNGPVASVSWLF